MGQIRPQCRSHPRVGVPASLAQVFFARTLLGQKPTKLHESRTREPLSSLPRRIAVLRHPRSAYFGAFNGV